MSLYVQKLNDDEKVVYRGKVEDISSDGVIKARLFDPSTKELTHKIMKFYKTDKLVFLEDQEDDSVLMGRLDSLV
jgi:ABC-type oligopeptide transport system ATPase subunit